MTFTARDKNPTVNKYWTYQQVFNRQVEADLIDIETELASISGGGGSGANTGLSNLTTTSINQNLIPQSSKTLGDSSNRWSGLWSTTGNFSGDLTVDTNVFFVDTTNNRVGINNASPSVALDVTGALKISGDATFDTSTFYIDSTNNVVISGSSTSDTGARIASVVDGGGSSSLQCFRAISYQSTSTSATASFYGRRAKGTASSPANVTADTPLSGFYAGGYYDAGGGVNGWTNAVGTIRIISAEAYTSSTSHSSYIEFATTASGATSRTIRGYIDSDGSWTIGTVRGNSSGTPGTLYAGIGVFTGNLTVDSTTFFVDSTNNRVGVLTTSLTRDFTVNGISRFEDYLELKEVTAPTSTANYGKLYVKSADSKLYFMNDSGTEYDLTTASTGANTTLSNLTSPTAINQDLLPSGTRVLGASGTRWTGLYSTFGNFSTTVDITGNLTVDTSTFFVDSTNNQVSIMNTSAISGTLLTVGAGGVNSTNAIIATNSGSTAISGIYYYLNGTVKGLIGSVGNTNLLITGTTSGDLAIRNTQAILFSTDGGTTAASKIDGSNNMSIGNSTLVSGARLTVGTAGSGSQNEIVAINGSLTGITATYYRMNGTTRGLFGLAGAANQLINGSVQYDFNIRNAQAILFSADGGTTLHAKLLSTGDFWVKTNVLYVSAVNSRVGINNASPSVALDVTGAYNQAFAGTTTNGFNITGDSITTGTLARITSNSTNTSTRPLFEIINDNTLATGAYGIKIQQDAVTSTNFKKYIVLDDITIWKSNGTDPNGALSGTAGDICLNSNGNVVKYCTGTTNWTGM